MNKKVIGRDSSCDYIIIDPKRRVSRKHAELSLSNNQLYIRDLGSTNGTYVNGVQILPGKAQEITYTHRVTLSSDYQLNLQDIMPPDDDRTAILPNSHISGGDASDSTIVFNNNIGIFKSKDKTVVFDRNKTELGEMLEMDNSPFITIGRDPDNIFPVLKSNISRYHCKIRLITPLMIEIQDLGSTNGTFADGEKLISGKSYQFDTSVSIKLGNDHTIELLKIFPSARVIEKKLPTIKKGSNVPAPGSPVTSAELKQFASLESVWKEFVDRQNQANNASAGFGIGGAVLGLAAAAFTGVTGGVGGLLLMSGGGILGRYLGQQESSKIRNDLTYEDVFLETYCCPRCKESFQKKPWITIRECFKCKIKFR